MTSVFLKALGCLALILAMLRPVDGLAETDINALMAGMTLREKIGQMTMITLNAVSKGQLPFSPAEPHELDPQRMKRVIVDYAVGTVFNIGHHAFSKDHWRTIISAMQEMAATRTRLKIPILYGIDALHGMNFAFNATLFPQQIGLAATWNPDLVEQTALVTAYEARAAAIAWVFAPTAEPGRSVVHSRFYESFGEDTHLAAAMTAATVAGYNANNRAERVGTTLKHFIGYSIPGSGRDRAGANIVEHVLRETFLPPFAAGINAGAQTVIVNLSDLNGVPVHGNKRLVQGLLKDELGFAGVVVSDWNAVDYLYFHHHVAPNSRQAIEMAVNAGIDLVMVPFDLGFVDDLEALVNAGRVSMARIDDAVRRVLAFKKDLGLFDQPVVPADRYPLYGSDAFKEVARRAAAQSLTLLKNAKGILPLARTAKVLVTGFAADSMAALNGGWSYTWQGAQTDAYIKGITIVGAIRDKIGAGNLVFVPTLPDAPDNIDTAVQAAGNVDAVVVCLGETPYAEVFGNIDDLTLHRPQLELAQRLSQSGKPVVLVLIQGRPKIITDIDPAMDAILLAYLPANEGGRAIADALFGDANPSGKLPFTYPIGPNALVPYDHRRAEAYAFRALYPFGWGLSYTSFAYANLAVEPQRLDPAGTLTISVDVKNTGDRPGAEAVQLYTSDHFASLGPPVKRLRGFKKIDLLPGETTTVTFTLTARDIAFVNADNHLVAEAGDFTVTVGGLSKAFELTENRQF
jgi:beta-glucosidase